MAMSNNILAQDEIDALLGGTDQKPESQLAEPVLDVKTTFSNPTKVTQEDVRNLLQELHNRAVFERDDGVRIIWNAQGVYPMTSGFQMQIEGVRYVSLGVLQDTHLVVGPLS